jgi:hypothetical protein
VGALFALDLTSPLASRLCGFLLPCWCAFSTARLPPLVVRASWRWMVNRWVRWWSAEMVYCVSLQRLVAATPVAARRYTRQSNWQKTVCRSFSRVQEAGRLPLLARMRRVCVLRWYLAEDVQTGTCGDRERRLFFASFSKEKLLSNTICTHCALAALPPCHPGTCR